MTGEDELTIDGIASCYGSTEPESTEAVLQRVLGVTAEEAASAVTPADTKAEPDDAELERMWTWWAERSGLADEPAADPELERGVW